EDPLHLGLPCYTKKSIIAEAEEILFNDKTHIVFYNCSAYTKEKDEAIKSVLEFIYKLQASSSFTKRLETSVKEIKDQETIRGEYMYLEDIIEEEKEEARKIGLAEGREEGLAEGREEGLAEGRAEASKEKLKIFVQNLKQKNFSIKEIIELTGSTEEEIAEIYI
ncbi:MAG: hypothetical protein MJ179_11700, partial [Treponema sp.]|nr:hypothetical protein [Treponema sp.]